MDENISYEKALETVGTAVKFNDIHTLRSTLQRFPVLQLCAGRNLLSKISLKVRETASENSRIVRATTDVIGCVVSPSGLITTGGKFCATNLFYGIRDLNEGFLQALLRRMILAKLNCSGCGLFVHVVLVETQQQFGRLPKYIQTMFQVGFSEMEAVKQPWRDVLHVLNKEGVVKGAEHTYRTIARRSSMIGEEERRRLHLRKEMNKLIRRRRRRRSTAWPCTSFSTRNNGIEVQQIFKLVTMYAACPEFVSEQIYTRGLSSYCSTKVLLMSDVWKQSSLRNLSAEDVRLISGIGRANFDPPRHVALASHELGVSKTARLENMKEETEKFCNGNRTVINPTDGLYEVWMPTSLGCQRLAQMVQQGQTDMTSIVTLWNSAEGKFVSSVDQIVVATLAYERVLEELLRPPFAKLEAPPSENSKFNPNTTGLLAWKTITECLRILDCVSERGAGYEKRFWERMVTILTTLEGAFVSLILQNGRERSRPNVNAMMTHYKRIEERLQGHVRRRQAKPKSNVAVLKVCSCLSVEMTWKHKRRLQSSAQSLCRCVNGNALFLRVPKPDLWFCWGITTNGDAQKLTRARKDNTDCLVSRWLYTNPSWSKQYNYWKIDIFRGILNAASRNGPSIITSEVEDILPYLVEDPSVRTGIFSEFTKSSKETFLNIETNSAQKHAGAKLQLVRQGIEKVWYVVSELSLFPLNTSLSLEELKDIETFLKTVVRDSNEIHDCIHDMPTLCKYISVMYRRRIAWEKGQDDNLMRVKIIAGLLGPQLHKRSLLAEKELRERTGLLDSVMLCFE